MPDTVQNSAPETAANPVKKARSREHELARPNPGAGWSMDLLDLENPTVIPPAETGFVQEAGILRADNSYCPRGALWRNHRPLTIEPQIPRRRHVRVLDGKWLWGGVLWMHFGHFLVESTSRLWGLDHMGDDVQGILFIPKRPKTGENVVSYQRDYVDLMGCDLPIKVLTKPTRVQQLIVPGQGFGLGRIIAGTGPFRKSIHNRFGQMIHPDGPERLYISRSKLGFRKGSLIGEARLETYLADHGYEIFHPEEHDLATQVARYKAAKQVIAAEGSAIHLFAMVARPDQQTAIVVRRRSGATDQIETHLQSFAGITPLTIDALSRTWKPHGPAKKRMWLGEMDMPRLQDALFTGGFLGDSPQNWHSLPDAEVMQMLGDGYELVETTHSPQMEKRSA